MIMIDERGDKLESEIKASDPSLTEAQVNNMVRQQLKTEFGG